MSQVWVLCWPGERSPPKDTGMWVKCGIGVLVMPVGCCWGWSSHGCPQHMAVPVSFLTSKKGINGWIHSGCAHASMGKRGIF